MGDQEQNVITFENTGRLVVSALAYPLENAKTLIQMGYEPLPPYQTKTLFGNPVLGLPNIFKYGAHLSTQEAWQGAEEPFVWSMPSLLAIFVFGPSLLKHIHKVDGLYGCYRGFTPWLSTMVLYKYSLDKMKENFPKIPNEDRNEDALTDDERLTLFSGVLVRGVLCRSVAIVITQPLHVVTVRTIAQFVGHEMQYTGVLSGLWTLIKEEGLLGMFTGLIPRLLGELFVFTVATTGVYLAHQYLVFDLDSRKYVDAIIQYVASACFYPFTVVSTCMSVTNSGLAAGSPPNMPHYHHMFDCWNHLQTTHQLKRGSSVLWRYYTPVSKELLKPTSTANFKRL